MTARSVGTGVARAALVIAVATLLSRVAGFARTLVFSTSVGATGVGDVYQTVNTIPNVVYEVAAGGVLAAVAVPLVSRQLALGKDREADQTASALLSWAVVVLLPLSILVALVAPWASRALLSSRATDASVALGQEMLVLFAPQVLLYGVGIVLSGVLQARHRFLAAALAPLLSSLVVIAAYLAYRQVAGAGATPATVDGDAVWVLAGGTTLGVVVLSLPLLVPVWRAGVRLRPTLRFPEGTAQRARSLAGAGLMALVAQQVAVFVTLWVTHHKTSAVGTVNVYQYVQAVYLLPYAVLAVPIATSAFPTLAHTATTEELLPGTRARDTLARSLKGIILFVAGAAAVLMAVSKPVGAFFVAIDPAGDRSAALAALPGALAAYAPGVVGFGVAALLTRALYVRGRPLYAALAVAAGWAVAAVMPLVGLSSDSAAGATLGMLGVASSLGMTLSALLLAWLVRRSWGAEALAGSGRTLGAAVVGVAVGLVVGDTVLRQLDPVAGVGGSLVAGVVVGLVVAVSYFGVMMLADRGAMQALRERGRARRRGDSS
ncbi:lipid II flippase MurJ [Knoellia koreensis]|uniref:Virulence factor MviN n=1 Tax=Knoellia koreensis TaxID=2730921 RepID=A0A849H4J4_9MICO|nr:virulence factor MviN [Knoellia sp. DB2414S]